MVTPCKGCTDRTVEPNCHTDCERYAAFRERYDIMARNREYDVKTYGTPMLEKNYRNKMRNRAKGVMRSYE